MASVKTWLHWCKWINMVTPIQHILQRWATMLSNLFSESYTIQEDIICNGQISTADEIFVREEYMNCMKYNTNW